MLAKFQSAAAIADQISHGYLYHTIEEDGETVGYFALAPALETDDEMQLSKIYVRAEYQGRGLGRFALESAEAICEKLSVRELWLTVNRHNIATIDFYLHTGFTIEEELVQDIGGGFVMDDYRMVKAIREP